VNTKEIYFTHAGVLLVNRHIDWHTANETIQVVLVLVSNAHDPLRIEARRVHGPLQELRRIVKSEPLPRVFRVVVFEEFIDLV